jgi:hypothetical protein
MTVPSGERNTRGRKLSRRRYINTQTQPNRNSASTQRDGISKAQPRNWPRVTQPQSQAAQRLRGGAGKSGPGAGGGWMESSPDEGAEIAGVRPHLSVSLSPPTSRRGKGYSHEPAVRAGGLRKGRSMWRGRGPRAGPPRDWRGSGLWLFTNLFSSLICDG